MVIRAHSPHVLALALAVGLAVGVAGATPLAGSAEARGYVWCVSTSTASVLELRVKPRRCGFHVAGASAARARASAADIVDVVRMRWRRWGGPVARARGVYAGNMGVRKRGVVRLSRRERCGDRFLYTRFRMRFPGQGADTFDFRLSGC